MSDLLTFSPPGALDTGTKSFAGAKATFFNAGTTTPRTVYTDQAETIPAASPLVADAAGLWPEIFASGGAVKVVVTYSDDTTGYTLDPCTKVAAAGAGAASVSFTPSILRPYDNVQEAIDSGTFPARTITAGAGISVTNGNGVGGDPVISCLTAGRNRIINGQGRINQRAYVSGTATVGANQYTLDRWRVVTSGQSLTFTGTNAGRTMTAPAGGCEQVIEGANIEGGTYVINWTGTATCTVDGTPRAKGATFALTANTNATIRMIGGTFTDVQVELGTVPTTFERLPFGQELEDCLRYYFQISGTNQPIGSGFARTTTNFITTLQLPVPMRVAPALSTSNTAGHFNASAGGTDVGAPTLSLVAANTTSAAVSLVPASGTVTVGDGGYLITNSAAAFVAFSAEL